MLLEWVTLPEQVFSLTGTRNLFEKKGCWDQLNLGRISTEKIFQ